MNSPSPPPSLIEDTLTHDHEDLDLNFKALKETLSNTSSEAATLFREFRKQLEHHMEWEEKVLFPEVRPHCTSKEQRSIESLEIDHDRIRHTLDDLQAALDAQNYPMALEHHDDLRVFLEGHNYDEEHGVYEEADRYLSADTARRITRLFTGAES